MRLTKTRKNISSHLHLNLLPKQKITKEENNLQGLKVTKKTLYLEQGRVMDIPKKDPRRRRRMPMMEMAR